MAHDNQNEFCLRVKELFPQSFVNKSVIDIGSLDINGNNKKYFYDCNYIGIDLAEGNNVDIVCPIEDYETEEKYDVVISTEMLEHCRNWEAALTKMYSILKDGGLLLFTAAGDGRGEHGVVGNMEWASPHTNDYYKNISNEMLASMLKPKMFSVYYLRQDSLNNDIQFYGIKI